jgi:hypothetical protein
MYQKKKKPLKIKKTHEENPQEEKEKRVYRERNMGRWQHFVEETRRYLPLGLARVLSNCVFVFSGCHFYIENTVVVHETHPTHER